MKSKKNGKPFKKKIWNISGASNLDNLNTELRANMAYIRRRRADVLSELPPTQISRVIVEITNRKQYDDVLLDDTIIPIGKIEKLRLLAGQGKITAAIEWIEDFLEESDEKLVIFAHHKEVQSALCKAFPNTLSILGEASAEERDRANKEFLENPTKRLIVCSMKASSEGIDLISAANMLIVEQDWTPTTHEQIIGRCNRMGQTQDKVNVWFMLGDETTDNDIYELLVKKEQITEMINEGKPLEELGLEDFDITKEITARYSSRAIAERIEQRVIRRD
jgi:SNF2 family DNA or RNA helicase